MHTKKARFGHRGKGGKGGKGKYGGKGDRCDDRSYRDYDRGYGSRSDWGNDRYDDWSGSSWDYGGRDDRWSSGSYGPSASNPRDRDRFVTQMMEDDRYEWRKQNDPDFVAAGGSSGGSASNPPKGGMEHDAADEEFDAALEKRRKHRKEMKANTHNKLDRLIDVAARLECVEEELAKVADGKCPEEKLLTCAEWEAIKQRSAEKGQQARGNAARDYEERKAKRDQAEQDRIDKDNRKRANVARNLDGKTDSMGFVASFGEAPTKPATDVPVATLPYLRTPQQGNDPWHQAQCPEWPDLLWNH